jgi:hypothetical protein
MACFRGLIQRALCDADCAQVENFGFPTAVVCAKNAPKVALPAVESLAHHPVCFLSDSLYNVYRWGWGDTDFTTAGGHPKVEGGKAKQYLDTDEATAGAANSTGRGDWPDDAVGFSRRLPVEFAWDLKF